MEQERKLDPAELANVADTLVRSSVATLAAQGDLALADAGRELLKAVARWYGIDFRREVEVLDEEDERRAS
jgi:hypothetical protein